MTSLALNLYQEELWELLQPYPLRYQPIWTQSLVLQMQMKTCEVSLGCWIQFPFPARAENC